MVLGFRLISHTAIMHSPPRAEVYYHDNSYSFPTPPRLPHRDRRSRPGSSSTRARGAKCTSRSNRRPSRAKKSGNILLAMGNALGKAIQEQKRQAAQPLTAEKEPAQAENADAKATEDARTNELVKNLTAAVLAELPKDVDEYTALRTLARYLARVIAEERAEDRCRRSVAACRSPAPGRRAGCRRVRRRTAGRAAKRPGWVDAAPGKVGDALSVCHRGRPLHDAAGVRPRPAGPASGDGGRVCRSLPRAARPKAA